MTGRDEESQEIMGAAMQFVKTGDRCALESYPLAALKKANYQLSHRDIDSGYRRAIKDLITELDEKGTTSSLSATGRSWILYMPRMRNWGGLAPR